MTPPAIRPAVLHGLTGVARELGVWMEANVRLTGVQVSKPTSQAEKNRALLRTFWGYDMLKWLSVDGAISFVRDPHIMNMPMHVSKQPPPGDYQWFPFEAPEGLRRHDDSSSNGAYLLRTRKQWLGFTHGPSEWTGTRHVSHPGQQFRRACCVAGYAVYASDSVCCSRLYV